MKKLLSLIVLAVAVTFLSGACTPKRATMPDWYRDSDTSPSCGLNQYWDGSRCVDITSGECPDGQVAYAGNCYPDPNCRQEETMTCDQYGCYCWEGEDDDELMSMGGTCSENNECASGFCHGKHCTDRSQPNGSTCYVHTITGHDEKDQYGESPECNSGYCDYRDYGTGLACGLRSSRKNKGNDWKCQPGLSTARRKDGDCDRTGTTRQCCP